MIGRLRLLKPRLWSLVMTVLTGLAVIVLAAMGVIYLQKQGQQASLQDQIQQLQRVASEVSPINEELKLDFAEASEAIPRTLENEDVIMAVLGIAEAVGFDTGPTGDAIQRIASGEPVTENIHGSEYVGLRFTMVITGERAMVEEFVVALDSTTVLRTLVIERLDVSDTGSGGAMASLAFTVYVLKG